MNDTIDILKRRRSVPPPLMIGPAPSADELATILTVASRVPDHGKLAPWRFVVFAGDARDRASQLALHAPRSCGVLQERPWSLRSYRAPPRTSRFPSGSRFCPRAPCA
jgi:nitroreductase